MKPDEIEPLCLTVVSTILDINTVQHHHRQQRQYSVHDHEHDQETTCPRLKPECRSNFPDRRSHQLRQFHSVVAHIPTLRLYDSDEGELERVTVKGPPPTWNYSIGCAHSHEAAGELFGIRMVDLFSSLSREVGLARGRKSVRSRVLVIPRLDGERDRLDILGSKRPPQFVGIHVRDDSANVESDLILAVAFNVQFFDNRPANVERQLYHSYHHDRSIYQHCVLNRLTHFHVLQ